ncbi:MAG: hypothetical protein L6R37_002984 [Teloschistes peruensis]|nr:MAG: hypothetical protein L6R37_002984 [Teloschistes peruensis]
MMPLNTFLPFALSLLFSIVSSAPTFDPNPFSHLLIERQSTNATSSNSSPQVDLGYERYQGFSNATAGLNYFLGVPPAYNYTGNEDCLFLNVFAPQGKTNLPVLVYIHGGGYGAGQANYDLTEIINTNNNSFIGVTIQYRLGAFGFLSSDEVSRYGVVNAGLRDQTFALQWVQSYISLFGGNPAQVTLAGESAGGGSVMLQAMAYGGNLGDSLFVNVCVQNPNQPLSINHPLNLKFPNNTVLKAIPASPYLPQQYPYASFVPSQSYYAFASQAGCFTNALPQGNASASIFNCLVAKDTETLQNASAYVSGSSRFGTWGFLPVTDGIFMQQLPSQQLLSRRVNGRRVLSGNNANEGPLFVPPGIETEDDFLNFLRLTFPLFTDDDIARVLLYYPSPSPNNPNKTSMPTTPNFATTGTTSPTALNVSTFATGQQQRAYNLYAETTFVCPSYWLAEAFSTAYKYQYSIPPAQHAVDVPAFFGPALSNQSPGFVNAFMSIWGNFITRNDPSISSLPSLPTTSPSPPTWPPYTLTNPYMLNLNQSGGVPFSSAPYPGQSNIPNVTQLGEPGLQNDFSFVNAYTWEGGRGMRCDFWRSVGGIVPE